MTRSVLRFEREDAVSIRDTDAFKTAGESYCGFVYVPPPWDANR